MKGCVTLKRIIKIFLASSIVEFVNERMIIENFIRNISDKFEEHYDIKIQPLLCENFDDAYTVARKQEEYNEKIRESEFCFFIFFTKAGSYTREEFETARKKFEETGKPKIYTYFKVIHDEEVEESLNEFMDELDKTFTHFYGNFDHIDTIKLRILLALKLQEMDFLEIKVDGDACVVDGEKTLSLKNVSEFANNSIFQELKADLYEVEERYFKLKAKYEKNECSQSEEREYIEIASKRQNLIDAIEELQKNIFNMSLRMCQDETRGEITLKQKEAYRLFEAGDIEGANNILDFAEIKNDYLRRKAIREAEQKKDAQIFIREGRTKIDILTMMSTISTRFNEIEEIYNEIVAVAFDEQVELEVVLDYALFLNEQNRQKKSIEVSERLLAKVTDNSDYDKNFAGSLYNLLGMNYKDQDQAQKAEEYYLKSIELYETLADENPERYNEYLAMSYNNAGIFYAVRDQAQKAEEYFLKATEIRKVLADENPERYNGDLADSYNNAGNFYNAQGQSQKVEEYYLKSIEIRKALADENPERYNGDLADSYNNAGVFYKNQGQVQKAEEYYLKAIEIYEALADKNPERYNGDLADSYNNAGNFYNAQGQAQKAEEYFLKAIEIRTALADKNLERYNGDLAGSYNDVGLLYVDQAQAQKAEEYFLKAIKLYEALLDKNSERYNGDLAGSYNNAGKFYADQGEIQKAEYYYLKAIELYEALADKNRERYNGDLATSYFNYGIFKNDDEYFKKAYELAKNCPNNPNCRQIIAALEN